MMETRKAMLLLAVLLGLLVLTAPVASQQGDDIIVSDADEVRKTATGIAQGLTERLATVGARVAAQYSDALRWIGLGPMPAPLQTLLDQVSAMVIVQYADANQWEELPILPQAFRTRLAQVSNRVVFHYADANRWKTLAYPTALFNDTTPPLISDITCRAIAPDSVIIAWTTDEFATSTVLYGTQPGVYPYTVSDPLYTKQHEITLTGLAAGTTYYYKVRSTDRSGNTATSSEQSAIAQINVYLPLVLRNYQ